VGQSGLIHGVLVHSEGLHYPLIQGFGPSYSRRAMFAVLGGETAFREWVVHLGGEATLAAPTRHGGWSGAGLVYIQAKHLFGPRKTEFRSAVEGARRNGALLALDLGDAGWIQGHGGPQAAYELATIHPDVLFATEASSAELGVPLEGLASVPVTM